MYHTDKNKAKSAALGFGNRVRFDAGVAQVKLAQMIAVRIPQDSSPRALLRPPLDDQSMVRPATRARGPSTTYGVRVRNLGEPKEH